MTLFDKHELTPEWTMDMQKPLPKRSISSLHGSDNFNFEFIKEPIGLNFNFLAYFPVMIVWFEEACFEVSTAMVLHEEIDFERAFSFFFSALLFSDSTVKWCVVLTWSVGLLIKRRELGPAITSSSYESKHPATSRNWFWIFKTSELAIKLTKLAGSGGFSL